MKRLILAIAYVSLAFSSAARAGEYDLTIDRQDVDVGGRHGESLTINGGIPGPTLRFKEGEDVSINVTNKLKEDTSLHWHGLLLPGEMDGVPMFNGFRGIKPGATFTYKFKIRQSGTYWYHSHSGGQEQEGLYGSIIIDPAEKDHIKSDRDYVVVLSDFTTESAKVILHNLKSDAGYYNYARRTAGDFFSDISEKGLSTTLKDRFMWGDMRMDPTDLSDVSGYTFLTNGKSPDANWTGLYKSGERVRLRLINASAMTYFDFSVPGLKLIVVAADGQNVQPVVVDSLRIAIAETYDVIVIPKDDKAYTIFAQAIDRTGYARGTLAPRDGMSGAIPPMWPRTRLTMADMGMDGMEGMEGMDHDMSGMDMKGMDMSGMKHDMASMQKEKPDAKAEKQPMGWAAGAPAGTKELDYADLKSLKVQKDTRPEEREITVRLGGTMDRYIWTLNGKKYEEADPIELKFGERVKLTFINETMMAHPMHLHGMFVQLLNGQPANRLPNKHTVSVPPGQSYSVMITADEAGEWAFHCHLLYHMESGMMNKVVVAKLDAEVAK